MTRLEALTSTGSRGIAKWMYENLGCAKALCEFCAYDQTTKCNVGNPYKFPELNCLSGIEEWLNQPVQEPHLAHACEDCVNVNECKHAYTSAIGCEKFEYGGE